MTAQPAAMAPAPAPRRGAGRWLLAIGLALVAAFAAAAWVQMRQVSLVGSTLRYEGDNLLWGYFQLEAQYLVLRDELREARRYPERLDADRLRQRYEVFASRLPLVEPDRVRDGLVLGEPHRLTLARVHDFLVRHDPLLGEASEAPLDAEVLGSALASLEALYAPVHALSLEGNRMVAEQTAERNHAVANQLRLSIALTAFQSLLAIAFAALAVRQFKALSRRGEELERLAGHLQEARIEAEAASQAKSAFLANMSHELRTPFNGMLGMLALLQASPLSAEQQDHLGTARESAQHLLDILNDILDISKLESGRLEIAPHPLDLHHLMHDVEALTRLSAEAKGLALSLRVDADVPQWVMADGKRVKQIVFNLVGNAIKFTARGEVRIHARRRLDGVLELDVADTGIGMDEAMIGRLFQRFAQGDASTSRRFGGTGLGLEISRNLARMMSGDIRVTSTQGEGSCFTVVLPLVLSEAPAAPPRPASVPVAGTQSGEPLDLLVADDHPVNRKFMNLLLSRMGHRVRLADDGVQAVQAVSERVPDLVFMDLHMPNLDGIGATQQLRAMNGPPGEVPIVALTADAFRETRDRVMAAGMDEFLAKPVQPDDIEALLRRRFGERAVLEPRAAQAEATLPPPAQAPAPTPVEAAPPVAPPPPAAPRRRFKPGDVAEHLDMAVIGDVAVAVSLAGYRNVLTGFLADEAGSIAALRAGLAAQQTGELKSLGHTVKGAAANMGLRALRAFALRVETEGPAFDEAQCAAAVEELDRLLDTARALCARMGLA